MNADSFGILIPLKVAMNEALPGDKRLEKGDMKMIGTVGRVLIRSYR